MSTSSPTTWTARDLRDAEIPHRIGPAAEHARGDADHEPVGEPERQERRDHARASLNEHGADPVTQQRVQRRVEVDTVRAGRHDHDRHAASAQLRTTLGR